MRLIFVRHGEPDYENDCLTERGRAQAEAAAKRLLNEGITEIFSSPNGRARETASFTAQALGLEVQILPYMHEISWSGRDGKLYSEDGHPWTISDKAIREGFVFDGDNWKQHPYFKNNIALPCYETVAEGIRGFMLERGFRQEGRRFFCTAEEEETVALFSHGGSGACALSALLSLPFPILCSYFPYDFTSVTVLHFDVSEKSYVFPRVELFGDDRHIRNTKEDRLFFGN